MDVLAIARKVLPGGIKGFLRGRHRRWVLRRALRELVSAVDGDVPAELLEQCVYGWGNPSWSAREEFIRAALAEARRARGPILECGSGLSTLLLGLTAQRAGKRVWSLEHNPYWAAKVEHELMRHGIQAVELCFAPLGNFGPYSWYAPIPGRLPRDVALVICDGPPGDTRGGRYGLLPEMRGHLAPGCVILMDDAHRPQERQILEQWSAELGCRLEISGRTKPFGRLVVDSG